MNINTTKLNESIPRFGLVLTLLFLTFYFYGAVETIAQTNTQTVTGLKAEIERYEQEIAKLKKEQEQLGQNISSTQSKAKTLQNEITNLNNKVKYFENQIYLTNINIKKTGAGITELEGNISDIQQKIDQSEDSVGKMLLILYQKDSEGLLPILLKNNNLSEFFTDIQQITNVNDTLISLIGELKNNKATLENNRVDLSGKKSELEQLNRQQGYEKTALTQAKLNTANILQATKGQEKEYQKLLTKAEELERAANLEIFRLEDKLRQAIDPGSLPAARPGILAWPVGGGGGKISQSYGCIETAFARRYYPDCNNGRGGFHNGLDVAASHGTPIIAAEAGRVIAMGNAPSAYGIWFTVEHSNGLVTAYTHLSVRSVTIGQEVKRGDIIGKVGNTGLSTGSHIHFMVYAPGTFTVKQSTISGTLPIGATLNPSNYLE